VLFNSPQTGILLRKPPVVASSTLTWDSGKKAASVTLSNGNLTASLGSTSVYSNVLANGSGRSSGKYYFEVTINNVTVDGQGVGVGNASTSLTGITGGSNDSISWRANGDVRLVSVLTTIQTWTTGNVLAIAYDLTAQKIWFRSNSSTNWNNSGAADPATGTGGISTATLNAGPYFPLAGLEINADNYTANFGATAYTLTSPSGFGNW
jgi:hypothetical protein